MTENELKSDYREICQLLSAKMLKQAFFRIKKLAAETGQGVYSDQIDDLEQTYRYVLKYTLMGVDDPERGKIYNHMVVSAFELTGRIHENQMLKYSQSLFYRKRRSPDFYVPGNPGEFLRIFDNSQFQEESAPSRHTTGEMNRISPEYWKKIIRFFWYIVFIDKLSNYDIEIIHSIFDNSPLIPELKSLLVTAMTFSVLRYYDEAKLELHVDFYENNGNSELIRQRCLTGILLVLFQYDERIKFYPKIKARIELMCEDPSFIRNAGKIMLQFLGSKETEKIRQKIQDEIIPEMIRISPNIRNKLNFEGLMDEGVSDDRNPDWHEIFNESPGLLGKMEELTKMQMEGADVFLSSFYLLKNFPFFNEFTNWFVPFYPKHPEIGFLTEEDNKGTFTSITGSLLKAPFLCNSDKYSFSFMLQHIADEGRNMMAGILKQETEQLEEIRSDEAFLDPGKEGEIVSNQYIQDLYRFFRLHPSKNDFEDIFSWKFDFQNKTGFSKIFDNDPEMIYKMAQFYFEKGYYQEALEIYGQLKDPDVEKLQKEAYCYQKLGNFEKALSVYRKAELYDVNKIWNLKKIAWCYRNLKLPEEALKVYQTIDSLEPDNLNVIYAIGYCYSETGRYQDALNSFFKMEYLSPGNKKVWKPIAWFSFLTDKTGQAEKYYKKLLDDHPDKYDLMNMGHVQWAMGKRESALSFYRQSLAAAGFNRQDFMTSFEEDLPVLITKGIPEEEVPIILDQLWYSLEE